MYITSNFLNNVSRSFPKLLYELIYTQLNIFVNLVVQTLYVDCRSRFLTIQMKFCILIGFEKILIEIIFLRNFHLKLFLNEED